MSAVIRHLNIAINGKPIVDDVDLTSPTANVSAWSARPVPANR